MAIRKIVTVPDTVLRKKAEKIKSIDGEVKSLAQDLLDTLAVAKDPEGAGIASTQIGVSKRICVVRNFYPDPAGSHDYVHEDYVLINPKIVSTSKETDIEFEGCLSVPDKYGRVERFKKIKVEALDINGDQLKIKAQDFFARTIQHEIDHLDGILFIDRIIGNPITEKDLDKLYEQEKK